MNKVLAKKKAYIDTNLCVACGICSKVCSLNAISIFNGIYAEVNYHKCVGCSKCANECPASIIDIR